MSVMHFEPFGDPFRHIDRLTSQLMSGTRTTMGMPMDVWQSGDGYHVALDLPGVDPDSVEITSERNVLTISAERKPQYEERQNVLVAERPQGNFTRRLQVGDALDGQNVQASYSNEVLNLTIPIAQSAKPLRIEVQSDQSQHQIDISSTQRSESSAAGQGETQQGTS
ncbi:MAG: Hsp20/alpha crystallin family protein [Nocardioidaceae bacterium]